jgi:hypothetical protein
MGAKTAMTEQDRQIWTDRTGQAEQDGYQDRQNRIGRARQAEQDITVETRISTFLLRITLLLVCETCKLHEISQCSCFERLAIHARIAMIY